MARLNVDAYILLHKLRKKYDSDKRLNDALDKIVWWSFPVVYYNFNDDVRSIRKDYCAILRHRARVRSYIRGMVATFPNLYLVSLTFSDDYIDNDYATLKKYVERWLNFTCLDWYACADYGKKTGRLHFHAVCAFAVPLTSVGMWIECLDKADDWQYGFYSIRSLSEDSNIYKVLNYAFKASSYSFKCADRDKIKPFHKRGVVHWDILDSDVDF